MDFGDNTRTRANDNIHAITAAVFDLDHLTPADFAHVAHAIQPYQYLAHSTHGHRESDICIRVVIPLNRPALSYEWRSVLAAAVKLLAIPADPSCKDLSRLYFLPTAIRGLQAIAERNEGQSLDVDALLASGAPLLALDKVSVLVTQIPELARAAVNAPARVDNGDSLEPTDLQSLRKRLKLLRAKYQRQSGTKTQSEITAGANYRLLDNALQGLPLTIARQADALHTIASILGTALPAHCPTEAAIELLRSSIVAMGAGTEGLDYWFERARFSYDRSMEKRIARDAEEEATNEAIRQRILSQFGGNTNAHAVLLDTSSDCTVSSGGSKLDSAAILSAVQGSQAAEEGLDGQQSDSSISAVPDSGSASAGSSAPGSAESTSVDDGWKSQLIWNDEGNGLKNCGANVATILYYSQQTRGSFRFNEVTKAIEVKGGIFAKEPASCLDVSVSNYLSSPLWKLNIKPHDVGLQIAYVARSNAYDPLKDYLRSLVWDGTPRADTWLTRYLGAAQVSADGQDISEYLRLIGSKWLISAVARALYPGCKVDTVLVTEGLQGALKSTAFGVLGGGHFSDTAIVLGDKDSRMMAASTWIIELAELVSFKRQEVEIQKAFFSSRVDHLRPPYGRAIEEFWRRAIFVGTTNADDYLHDPTGNRRYWPLRCGAIDIQALVADRDQLWAEAVARLDAGTLHSHDCTCYRQSNPHHFAPGLWWFVDRAEEAQAEAVASERLYAGVVASRVPQWWYSLVPAHRPQVVRALDVATQALAIPVERVNRALEADICAALKRLGLRKSRESIDGIRQWVWIPTAELLQAAQSKGAVNRTHLGPVPQTKEGD